MLLPVDSCWLLVIHWMLWLFSKPPLAMALNSASSPTQIVES